MTADGVSRFEPPVCPGCGQYATTRHLCPPPWLIPVSAPVLTRPKKAA